MKRLPIGKEDFKKLIDQDCYYIDKTNLVSDILAEEIAFYTRPRRFGKTLAMSMLSYFFSIKEKENAYLFNGLDITKNEEALRHQNQYPVIFVTLKDLKDNTFMDQLENFKGIISELVSKNKELITSPYLDEIDKDLLKKYKSGSVNKSELQRSLRFLCSCLELHYHKKVIVLIDEYDVPLQDAYLNNYYDEMIVFLRNVFSNTLKTNDSLEKGVLTGCLRIARESIFTGLNNFNVYSILQQHSNTAFGFTPENTAQILKDYDLESYENIVEEWYDGYLFGQSEIYNPWSVLKFIQKCIQESPIPESFWANTSGNDIIYRYIQQGTVAMRNEFDALTRGKLIEKTINPELTYREMEDTDHIYSFLLFTGYLKIVETTGINTYKLKIPNKEIETIYVDMFAQWFNKYLKQNSLSFYSSLINEEEDKAREILNGILFQSISYFDAKEDFYHGFLAGMLQDHHVISNRESGSGRFDLAIIPDDFMKRGIIIECKHSNSLKSLEKESELAVEQIKEKQYIEGYLANGYTDFIGYGIAFYKKSCFITKLVK